VVLCCCYLLLPGVATGHWRYCHRCRCWLLVTGGWGLGAAGCRPTTPTHARGYNWFRYYLRSRRL
jgi:hypothetical protein